MYPFDVLFLCVVFALAASHAHAFVEVLPTTERITILNKIPKGFDGYSRKVRKNGHRAILGVVRSLRTQRQQGNGVCLNMISWEDLVYQSQSAASQLASTSLQNDPSNLLSSLPIMYGAGLLTSLSPCVWGLLPLTMTYISTAAGVRKDGKTLLPTLAFAAGLAVVFSSLGVAAAELGGVFGGSSSSTNYIWLSLVSNGICLAMGLQLLELVQLPLPSMDMFTKGNSSGGSGSSNDEPILLDQKGFILKAKSENKEKEGSLFRTFLLGGTSALVASPCATPVLTSILGYVASANSPVLGGSLLLAYTFGYSTPLLVIAGTGGQALVQLRQGGESITQEGNNNDADASIGFYATIAPWVTPCTAGILLWYGTNGILTALFGDPSLAGLAPILE